MTHQRERPLESVRELQPEPVERRWIALQVVGTASCTGLPGIGKTHTCMRNDNTLMYTILPLEDKLV
jgi:hypothetical protein